MGARVLIRAVTAIALATVSAGCSLLFPTDFADRSVRIGEPAYEGMIVTALVESRDAVFAGPDEDGAALAFEWSGHPDWTHPSLLAVTASTRRMALELELPSALPLAEGELAELQLSYAGDVVGAIEVIGLEELRRTGGVVTADLVADVYSRIELSGDVLHFEVADSATNRPVRLRATGEIVLGLDIAVDAVGASAGPGACVGNCPGDGPDAGDGAGHAVPGDDGSGDDTGGAGYGNARLIPLSEEGGSRGGGTDGGGGGGVLEVSSLSRLMIAEGGARLSADGGDGSGGDGGGSGGAVWVRAPQVAGQLQLSTLGGNAASDGRVRLDVPDPAFGQAAAELTTASIHRGPVFVDEQGQRPPRALEATTEVASFLVRADSLGGSGAAPFTAWVQDDNGVDGADVALVEPGLYRVDVEVAAGRLYRLCLVEPENDLPLDELFTEGQTCVVVAMP